MDNTKASDVKMMLYNTLTRRKEDFVPIDAQNVRMYVCGPTVYDFAHIGNARPAIVFDVLYRLLRHLYGEDHVTYVRNITDLDDKINARAARDFPDLPLNEAIREVTEKTATQYQQDMKALGCLDPTLQPRATENIAQMAEIIQSLLDKGNAYITSGAQGAEILFSVTSMPEYGALSNRNLEEQKAGARIDVEGHKRHPGDFVLWKESSENEPGWDVEFTENGKTEMHHGRPGWHLECSAMSDRFLWQEIRDRLSDEAKARPHVFDIHGGGLDLIFPHHENEIAQSRCSHETTTMANYWMHNGFLQVEGEKMSKSLGNFFTVHELLHTETLGGRRWPGETLRLAMLMTHYKEPIDFSTKRLVQANNILRKWRGVARSVVDHQKGRLDPQVLAFLVDDLNTAGAIQRLSQMAKTLKSDEQKQDFLASTRLMGIEFGIVPKTVVDTAIEEQISARLAFIAEKNWTEADLIRDELLKKGIRLKDGKDPESGERITTWEEE